MLDQFPKPLLKVEISTSQTQPYHFNRTFIASPVQAGSRHFTGFGCAPLDHGHASRRVCHVRVLAVERESYLGRRL